MPYKDRATYLAKQREFAARRRAAKRAGNPLPLPDKTRIVHSNPLADNPVPVPVTRATRAFKLARKHAPIARPAPAVPPDRAKPAPLPRNVPQTGLSWLELATTLVSGNLPKTGDLRPRVTPTHAQPADSPKYERPAVPVTKRFRLPYSMQSPRKSPAVASLIKRMFG